MADIFVSRNGQSMRINPGDLALYEQQGWQRSEAPGQAYQHQGYNVFRQGNQAIIDIGGVGYNYTGDLGGLDVGSLREYTGNTTSGGDYMSRIAQINEDAQHAQQFQQEQQVINQRNAIADQLRPLLEARLGRGVNQQDIDAILAGQDVNAYVNSLQGNNAAVQSFRPRGENENMTDYLVAKNAANPGSVNFGTPNNQPPTNSTAPTTNQSTPVNMAMETTSNNTQPPEGATYISDPSQLKGLTESQIWREPGTGRIFRLAGQENASTGIIGGQKATLYGPNGQKEVVDVGSQRASDLQSQGWGLTPGSYSGSDSSGDMGIGTDQTQEEDPYISAIKSMYEALGMELPNAMTDPFQQVKEWYQTLYKDMGLSTVKQQIEDINKQISEQANKRDDEIREINDDPWLTEGVRLRRINKVNDKYDDKIKNLTNQFNMYDSVFQSGIKQVEFLTGKALELNQNRQSLTQDLVLKAMEMAQKAAESAKDDVDWGVIGQDEDGRNIYGFINKSTMQISGGTSYSGGSSDNQSYNLSGNYSAQQIADAIKQVESNGNYNAQGASGEFGAYQFMPGTWASWSQEYAEANGIRQSLMKNATNQDAVAQFKIQQWLNQGLNPQQIAAKWNSGSEVGWENKVGVNRYGVNYNVPAYVNKVLGALSQQTDNGVAMSVNLSPKAKTWFEAINSGKATFEQAQKVLSKSQQTELLGALSGSQSKPTELQSQMLTSATKLSELFKQNKLAVGKSAITTLGDWMAFPGTKTKDFIIQYNNLKSLLSLDNIKLLKGQGQVSDAERKLLAEASSNLNRFSSEETFSENLNNILNILKKVNNSQSGSGSWTSPSGNTYNLPN